MLRAGCFMARCIGIAAPTGLLLLPGELAFFCLPLGFWASCFHFSCQHPFLPFTITQHTHTHTAYIHRENQPTSIQSSHQRKPLLTLTQHHATYALFENKGPVITLASFHHSIIYHIPYVFNQNVNVLPLTQIILKKRSLPCVPSVLDVSHIIKQQ